MKIMMNSRIRLGLLVLVLIKMMDVAYAAGSAAHPNAEVDSARLKTALSLLDKTETGKAALAKVKELDIPIQSADISKTEIVATRSMDGSKEKLSYQIQVLVARDKDPVFQALDLAHELVHATNPKRNPFDPKLSASEYVRHGIEGEGGEAQAIAQECKVGKELIDVAEAKHEMKNETVQLIKARCQFVWNTADNESKWKQSFYQVGQYYRQFTSMVRGMDMNLKVEAKSPIFASAVAHKPYPLALLEEYIDITKRICEKNRKIASEAVSVLEERCRAVSLVP
jgi:hypothetical protein